ncbi:hypothetical protein D3C76_1327390 [compost metagenome]
MCDGHGRHAITGFELLGEERREDRVVALINHAPHQQGSRECQRQAVDTDCVQVDERHQSATQRTGHDQWAAANFVGQAANERNAQHRDQVARDRDPQVDAFIEADAIGRLHRIGRTENGGHDRDHVHQRYTNHHQHAAPAVLEGGNYGRLYSRLFVALRHECRGLLHFTTDDEACN